MIITHSIQMELTTARNIGAIQVMQSDKYTRDLAITLTANYLPWSIPEGTEVAIRFRKSDGTGGNYNTMPNGEVAYSINGNVLTVKLAPQVLTKEGAVALVIGMVNGDSELNTFVINLTVEKNPGIEPFSSNYYKFVGALSDAGWDPDKFLGTDENGNVVARPAEDLLTAALKDGGVAREKLADDIIEDLEKAQTAMQPSVYDPQNLGVDIFAYAQARANAVMAKVNEVKQEIADAYKLSDTLKYTKLGDAVRGVLDVAKDYLDAALAEYEAFTIEIVEELPAAGEDNTFYLIPKASGNGYDKYWYITDEDGNHVWDVFGASSTVVVEALPEVGEADVDYILQTGAGYLYYKYIDGAWQMIAGSLAYVGEALPEIARGNEFTDYYIGSDDSYTHYRFIGGAYRSIGGDTYTKQQIDSMMGVIRGEIKANTTAIGSNRQSVETNASNIAALGNAVAALQQELRNLDVEGYTYYATFGRATLLNGTDADNVFTLHECKDGAEEVKSQFVIAGGGSADTGTTTNLVVERITSSPVVATPTDKVVLEFDYSSTDDDGEEIDGTYTWKLGGTVIKSGPCVQGVNTFDMTEFVSVGTQKFTLTVVDEGGSAVVKSWTVQVVDVRLDSSFSDRISYPAGNAVNFTFTPYGAVSKTVHFILDGVELESVETTASGTLQSYALPAQAHGAHLLECYITAVVNNMEVETEHIFRDIVWFDSNSDVPVIGCIYRYDHYGKVTARQYDTTNIAYYVFDPSTAMPTVTHTADGAEVSTQTLSGTAGSWNYKTDAIGEHVLVISCKSAVLSIVVDVQELGIDVSPVTANLAFDFNPAGLSNAAEDRLWKDGNSDVAMQVSDNFDWNNGGYQTDADGNQYFCVKAGTTATILYKLFERDASAQGAQFKTIFKVTNVRDVDATFLSCVAGITPVGLRMDAHAAYLMTSATGAEPLYMPYSEDDVIEFELNIHPLNTEDAEANALIMSYEDGTGYRPLIYDAAHRLYQYAADAVPITIGSADCDVHIYRMKAYTSALTDADILSNFIADARDAETMLARYDRNQIYDENNALTPESVAAACPDLKIIKIDCPYFTQDKNEMIKNTAIECIHKNGDPTLDNWTVRNCYHSGQGTTSNEYGAAGRNLNIYMCFDGTYQHKRVTHDPDYITELTMGDGTKYVDGTGKVTLTRTSVPNALFNIKVNIASSENANNALLAKRYHRYLPYTPVSARRNANAKTTMEFVNCVVFVRENDPDLTTHREFQDTNWHFYALGNIGDSKDTDQTRTNDPDDHNEFVVEIADNTKPNSAFPTGVTDENGKQVCPISEAQWVAGNPAYDSLMGNWGETFEFRYTHPDITDAEESACVEVWNSMYKWMITASDEAFVAELGNWFIEDAALYMYLFTERYTMLDNRAKNTFWHWAKVYITDAEATAMGEAKASRFILDNEKAAINNGYRFDFWDYDNDTAIGINNSGEMTQPYGREDTDYRTEGDPNSGYVFNAAESTFFCRIRDLMYTQLQAMYLSRETAGAWSATGLITEFDNWQNQFPEELWRLDTERKYYRTYLAGTKRFLETMMNGRKRYHRRQWERDQEVYMGTKYVSAAVKADQIMFRCNTPLNAVISPNYDLSLVPFSDMYLSVLFGNSAAPKQIKAKAGQTYTITAPEGFMGMTDTAILVYAASRIQALNDLSGCYIHDNDFSKASKLQTLIIGNSTEGYANVFMTELNIGNNPLLQDLNVRNCPNLVGSVNLTGCGNLERFFAEGTAIAGVTFAPNGKIVSAYLPGTINSLTLRNLAYLTDLQVSYDNLETLTEENSVVDELAIVRDAVDTLQTLRLIGIDWVLAGTSLLNQILKMNSAVLSGKVYISGAIRNQELVNYANAWPDLVVSYEASNLVTQYLATYLNADGTVLYEAYVDRGELPPDPFDEGLIGEPTLAEDEQYTYSFDGWDGLDGEMLTSRTITAVYTKALRTYTVTWYALPGLPLGSLTVEYGSSADYPGGVPTREDDEGSRIYHLFKRWKQSTACITGDLDVYAEWVDGYQPGEVVDTMTLNAAQIYGMCKAGVAQDYLVLKDRVPITLGFDPQYENIAYTDLISKPLKLDGATCIDTGLQPLKDGIDKAWTLVVDCKFKSTTGDQTMLCCMQEDGYMGFKVKYSGGPSVQWSTNSYNSGATTYREIMVIRHIAGSKNVLVYSSKAYDAAIGYGELAKTIDTQTDAKLYIGATVTDAGNIGNYATGELYSLRFWEGDLGDEDCRKIVAWPRETYLFEVGGFGNYYLAANSVQTTSIDFICASLLERNKQMNTVSSNEGGFSAMPLFSWMHSRLYDAFPTEWRNLFKQCIVKHNNYVDGTNANIQQSNCYLWLPSYAEVQATTAEPWIYEYISQEKGWVSFFVSNETRLKFNGHTLARTIDGGYQIFKSDNDPTLDSANVVNEGDLWLDTNDSSRGYIYVDGTWLSAYNYWLRGASVVNSNYFGTVGYSGYANGNGNYAGNSCGVCPRFSI